MDSSLDTKSKFIKLFGIRRIIDNDSISSNKVWIKLVNCLEERQLKTILSAGIGQLAHNPNPTDRSSQMHVIDKINASLSAFEDEKKKPIAMHNTVSKVFYIDTLHFKINEYLDFKSLMRLCRVNSEWLYNAYKPQSQYKFNTRQCHVEYIPPTNDAAERGPHGYISLVRKLMNDKNEDLEDDTVGRRRKINDHHIPGLKGGRGIYNVLRFSQSKILIIHKWHSISNVFYSNLVHFNKIEQLDVRYLPRYDKYTYRDEHLKEAKKTIGCHGDNDMIINNNNNNNNNDNVRFYGVLSKIMEKNFHHLSRLTFYQSLLIDLDAWKLFFNGKKVNFSNIKYFAFKHTAVAGFCNENEKLIFTQQEKLEIKNKIITKMAHQLANNVQELKIDSRDSGRNHVYWLPYFLIEFLSHVTKNKEHKNKHLKYVSVNTCPRDGFDANDIKRCRFSFKDKNNHLTCITINLDGNMNDNEIDNVTKIFIANDLQSKRNDEFGIICQELKISSIFRVEPREDDQNVLLCETIVKLLQRMNNINSQCLNKYEALKGLKKLYIGKFMYENNIQDLFELFDEIDKLPTSLKEIEVEIGQRKIGYNTCPNAHDMNEMVPSLEDVKRVCDILQKWALNKNQSKKCVIEFGAFLAQDFGSSGFSIFDHFDFDDTAKTWFEIIGNQLLVEKLRFNKLDKKVDHKMRENQLTATTEIVSAWYTNSNKYNHIEANIKTFTELNKKMCLRLKNF